MCLLCSYKAFMKWVFQKENTFGENGEVLSVMIFSVYEQHTYKQALQYYKMIPKQNMSSARSSLSSNRSSSPNSCNIAVINENEVRCVVFIWFMIVGLAFDVVVRGCLFLRLFMMFPFHSLIAVTGEVQNCIVSLFSKWEQSSFSWGLFVLLLSPFIGWTPVWINNLKCF